MENFPVLRNKVTMSRPLAVVYGRRLIMNIGIVGAGLIAKELLHASSEFSTINIIALLSRKQSISKNQQLCTKYNIEFLYSDYHTMLMNPDIETIYVAVPNQLHYEYSLQALEMGKHVICEKPFTITTKEAKSLKSIAVKNNLMIFEAISTIHLQNYHQIKSLIDNNSIGEIKLVTCNFSKVSSRYADFKAGRILPAFDPSMYGGALMDLNCYNFHFIFGLFGEPLNMTYHANISKGIDTSGVALFKYPDFICTCIAAKDSNAHSSIEIQGDEGTIYVDSPSSLIDSYTLYDNRRVPKNYNNNSYNHRMINTFIEIINLINTKDFIHCYQLLDHSINVVSFIEKART